MKTEELEEWAVDWAPTADFQNTAWLIPQGTPSSPQAGPPDFKNALSLLQFRELKAVIGKQHHHNCWTLEPGV